METLMEILAPLEGFKEPATQAWNAALRFEAPIPDAALLAGVVLFLIAMAASNRRATERVRAIIEDAYRSELAVANRRAHAARRDLDRANREIEHERQRKRRLENRTARQSGPKPARLREVKQRAASNA